VGNYTQIVKKSLILSGTLGAVDKAGRRSELAYQIAKRGKEVKRDVEAIMLANQAAHAGSASLARRMGSLGAWVKTNVSKAADGANPVHTSGAPMQARTDGTPRDFVEDHVKEVVARMWEEGAEPKILMVGAHNKQRASAFEGVVQRSFDISNASPKPTAVIGAVDVIVTDFGTLRIVPNRWQRKRDAWVLDPEMADASYLRPFKTEKLAKTGDAEKRHLLAELTLRVKQEAGLGLIADLTTENVDPDPDPGD